MNKYVNYLINNHNAIDTNIYAIMVSVLLGINYVNHFRPAKKTLKTFSCFENFVESCDGIGSPKHSPDHKAIPHLLRLLQNTVQRLQAAPENQAVDTDSVNKLTVIGFSKVFTDIARYNTELCIL